MNRTLITLLVAGLLSAPVLAQAQHHGHGHKPHRPYPGMGWKPGHHHYKPHRRHYHHRDLKGIATFAVLAGVTYAVVNNSFYRRQGDNYVYVERPPTTTHTYVTAPSTVTTSTTVTTTSHGIYTPGTVVVNLPARHQVVSVNGVTYRKFENVWFAPIDGTNQFIVVHSPL